MDFVHHDRNKKGIDAIMQSRQLILSLLPRFDSYVVGLRNAMKLSVESTIQSIMAILGFKYWIETSYCDDGRFQNVADLIDIDGLMVQYSNSYLGMVLGIGEEGIAVPVEFAKKFLESFADLNLNKIDVESKGFLIDTLIQRCLKGALQRLRVPIPLQNFLIGCLSPQKGETVFDPCCGVGDLLIGAMRHAHSRLTVAGIDASRMASKIFLLRSVIEYGVGGATELMLPNDIMGKVKYERSFDIAICYPTMGRRLPKMVSMIELPGKIAQMSEIQALMHCLNATKAGGRIGIILPDVLIESDSFGVFREWVEPQAELIFSYAFDAQRFNFSLPPTSVSGLIFVKRQSLKCSRDEIAMAVDEPIDNAVAAFNAFRASRQIW